MQCSGTAEIVRVALGVLADINIRSHLCPSTAGGARDRQRRKRWNVTRQVNSQQEKKSMRGPLGEEHRRIGGVHLHTQTE